MALPAKKEPEEVIIPDGGIADFIISDEDFEELARQEASKTYGAAGIAEFQEQASRMAKYGRGGDQFVAHLAPGEIIVPAPLIENNPELRDSIFGHLREMGIENPEQYVVGASANSINPETGLMEFGFLSKVFKGVKRVVKGVGKVLKKAAPIILPIIGTAVLGPVWGAALGSGIATLINGGSLKDAAISAAISGGTGAVVSGFGGPGNFGQNVSQAMDAGSYLNTVGSRLGSTIDSGEFFSEGSVFGRPGAATTGAPTTGGPDTFSASTLPDVPAAGSPTGVDVASADLSYMPDVSGVPAAGPSPSPETMRALQSGRVNAGATTVSPYKTSVAVPKPKPTVFDTPVYGYDPTFTPAPAAAASTATPTTIAGDVGPYGGIDYSYMDAGYQTAAPTSGGSFFQQAGDYAETAGDYLFRGGQSREALSQAAEAARIKAQNASLVSSAASGISPTSAAARSAAIKAGDAAAASAGPGLIERFGPTAALTGAGLLAGGFFKTPVPTEEELSPLGLKRGPTGADLLAADVAAGGTQYTLPTAAITPTSATGPTTVASAYGLPESPQVASLQEYLARQRERLQNPFGPMRAAEGGEVYPRRNGGIMPYEGTQNEDSVRALLMPGEFVMTTNAVKGAGNGDLNRGINNMYGIMRGLEQRGRAMS